MAIKKLVKSTRRIFDYDVQEVVNSLVDKSIFGSPIYPPIPALQDDGIVIAAHNADNFEDSRLVYYCGGKYIEEGYGSVGVATDTGPNIGGASQKRVGKSAVVENAVVGLLTPNLVGSGTSSGLVPTKPLSNTVWDQAVGRPLSYGVFATMGLISNPRFMTGTYGFGDRNVWELANGKSLAYDAEGLNTVMFYCNGGDSDNVRLQVEPTAEGTYGDAFFVDLSGQSGVYVVNLPYTVRRVQITNQSVAGPAWVIGLNVSDVKDARPYVKYDAVTWWYAVDRDSQPQWVTGDAELNTGASDFALREVGGRTFGSWHGGHSDETVTMYAGVESKTTVTTGSFDYAGAVSFESVSKITSDLSIYNCLAIYTFQPGSSYVYAEIETVDGSYQDWEQTYIGMTINNSRFRLIVAPIVYDMSPMTLNSRKELMKLTEMTLYDPETGHSISSSFTNYNSNFGVEPGAWVQKRAGDNKSYYNPFEDSEVEANTISLLTVRRYNLKS